MISDQIFFSHLNALSNTVNAHLDKILHSLPQEKELARPKRLIQAMRHGVLNGGKRLRPFLLVQTAHLFDVPQENALHAACALECLHSYSLIHDDLPAMDNDALRRGQPTVHIAFDEATAILAGDALLTLAFDMMSDEACHADLSIRIKLVQALARASGLGGMIGGQMMDIEAETQQLGEIDIRLLQEMKTGALLQFSCEAGALLAKADAPDQKALRNYGKTIGFAFQLADDLLDLTSDAQTMGKATGKDASKGKGTFIALWGEEKTRFLLQKTIAEAESHIASFGSKGDILRKCAQFIATRTH